MILSKLNRNEQELWTIQSLGERRFLSDVAVFAFIAVNTNNILQITKSRLYLILCGKQRNITDDKCKLIIEKKEINS